MLHAFERNAHGATVATVLDRFDAIDRAHAEECAQRTPMEGRPETQLEVERVGCPVRWRGGSPGRAQLARFQTIALLEECVETPHAAEAARERNIGDRQRSVREKPLREQQPLCLCELHRRNPELGAERAAQVPVGNAQTHGKLVESLLLERAVFHHARGSLCETRRRVDARVAGRELGSAAQARPVAVGFRGGCARKESAVLALRRPDGAHRPAIDARRRNGHEKPAVESRITRSERSVTRAGVECHARIIDAATLPVWPFSDMAAHARGGTRRRDRALPPHGTQRQVRPRRAVSLRGRPEKSDAMRAATSSDQSALMLAALMTALQRWISSSTSFAA